MDPKQIRVAILDDNPRFRKHLRELFGKEPDINVVAEAEPGPAGIEAVEEHKPEVILIDKDRPFTENLEITEMIVSRFPDTRIIVLSMESKNTMLSLHPKHTKVASSCQTWACYPLCQDCCTEDLMAIIRQGH